MFKKLLSLFILFFYGALFIHATSSIDHVVVLMLENRAFDHIIGFMKRDNPEINGCLPTMPECSNKGTDGKDIRVSSNAPYVASASPSHSCNGVLNQQYGFGPRNVTPAPMSGFIKSYEMILNGRGDEIMDSFAPEHVPALTTLAKEFALFDGWFSSIPGPTFTNRLYANSATSHGVADNVVKNIVKGFPQKTIMETLDENGKSWRCYFQDVPALISHDYVRLSKNWLKFRTLQGFYIDADLGTLPTYSWIEPRYYDHWNWHATDQHPDHDVALGDNLIADIYSALRNGPKWENTLLIVTYDEHGGFYDHIPPPKCPNPDGLVAEDIPFDFSHLGVRVPTVMASPWIKKGTLIKQPSSGGQYEHSSIPATLKKMFMPDASFLTKRDAWAATFDHILSEPSPRTDTPKSLPKTASHREFGFLSVGDQIGQAKIEGLQVELLEMVAYLIGEKVSMSMTEMQASEFVIEGMLKYLGQKME